MELSRKHIAIVLVVLFLGSVAAAGVAIAQTPAGSSLANSVSTATPGGTAGGMGSVNPAWTPYENAKAAGKVATQTPDGRGLGNEPAPVDLSKLTAAPGLAQEQTFTASYDLRTLHKVSPVEDQGSCGSCWTFATFGSLESYLLPGSVTRYSENNLKNLNDFNTPCCSGGSAWTSTAYLARWGTTMKDASGSTIRAGPVTLTCDPYSYSCADSTTCSIAAHVQNVYFLPLKTSLTDNSAIKSALTTYGGVYTAFQWESYSNVKTAYYNPSTAAYYDKTTTGQNHAVTIVGWNDDFPRTWFSTVPPGNGAWLCKNSWGTSFGQSGYFWVSYFDINMGHRTNAVFTATSTSNYKTNYQYDPFGWVLDYGWGDSKAYGANVFTATSTGTLKAVSFWTTGAGTQYTVQIYVNPTNPNKPTSGTLKSTIVGTAPDVGYYTKSLITTVPLTNGEKFAVVIKFTTPGSTLPVPVQYKLATYDSKAPNAKAGQSFVSHDGTTWYDLTSVYPASYSLVCNIHAFAS